MTAGRTNPIGDMFPYGNINSRVRQSHGGSSPARELRLVGRATPVRDLIPHGSYDHSKASPVGDVFPRGNPSPAGSNPLRDA